MKSNFGHIQINVLPQNMAFYKDLFALLGWRVLYDDAVYLGVGDGGTGSLWFAGGANSHANDFDGVGMNHLGIHVEQQADVDAAVDWLRQRGVMALFETPRHRPEFSAAPDQTYYQVMFASPDRVLFEVVYIGKKE